MIVLKSDFCTYLVDILNKSANKYTFLSPQIK